MIYKKIALKDGFPMLSDRATLTSYCVSNHNEYPYDRKRKTILVIPGGGYEFVSDREGEPIALKFLALDYNVFVLRYTIAPDIVFPYPFIEAFAAIAYIRKHAEEYNVDTNHIGVMGFSAGGHLAATISCYRHDPYYSTYLCVDNKDLEIDFTILCYAVNYAREDEFIQRNISKEDKELEEYLNISDHIKEDFPPTFIWTTKTDDIVPFHHSTGYSDKLEELGIIHETHIFPVGPHGGATCDLLTNTEEVASILKEAQDWIKLAANFIEKLP